MLRKFCSNIFRNDNEALIRQVLDINLAKLLTKTLKLARTSDYRAIDLKEVLNMLSLFVVDDTIIEYFLTANVASELFFFMKEDRLDDKGSVINAVTIMTHMLRLKSYSFSKNLKLDFLVFLLRNYEKTEEEEFKNDLLKLLASIYEIKEFRKLMNDEEVLIELKYRTDITELEDLISKELKNSKSRPLQKEIPQPQTQNREDSSWLDQFPAYALGAAEVLGLLNNEAIDQINREEKLMEKNIENESIILDSKFKKLQEFLNDVENARLDNEGMGRVKRALEDFSDLKELVNMQQEAFSIKTKARVSDLEKENRALRETIDGIQKTQRQPASRNGTQFHVYDQGEFERESAGPGRPPSSKKLSIPSRNMREYDSGTRSILVDRKPQTSSKNQGKLTDSGLERQAQYLPSISPGKDHMVYDDRGFTMERPVSRDKSVRNDSGAYDFTKPIIPAAAGPKRYPPLGKHSYNHDPKSVSNGNLGQRPALDESKLPPAPPLVLRDGNYNTKDAGLQSYVGLNSTDMGGSGDKESNPADSSFLRNRIEMLEKKLNDSMNMLSVSNRKEIDLMVENRKLKSQMLETDKIVKEDPSELPPAGKSWDKDQFSFHNPESESKVNKYQVTPVNN